MEILNKLTKKMPASLFRAGILSLAVSAVVLILKVYFYYGYPFVYVIYNDGIYSVIAMIVCGLIVEAKKGSYKIFAIPLIIVIANYLRFFYPTNIIYIVFFSLMLIILFGNVNKKLLATVCIVCGLYFAVTEIIYWAYYLFNRIVLAKYSISSNNTISGFLSLVQPITYYFGFAIVMKRMLEYKSEAQRKTELVNKQPTAKEQLIELKIRLDAGEIDKDKYDAMRKDIIDKL